MKGDGRFVSVDAVVASLQPLAFDAPPPYTAERFRDLAGDVELPAAWRDLETQMRNAIAEERARARATDGAGAADADRWKRPASGCSLYWTNRVRAAFAEKDPLKRDTALDRAFWDAAGELTPATAPLSRGALQTYAVRLAISLRRAARSAEAGGEIFNRLTAASAPDAILKEAET